MATPQIGYLGEPLDILIRQGGTFGPFSGTMVDTDGTPIDLTGCTIRGSIRHKGLDANKAPFPFNLVVTSAYDATGTYSFTLTDEVTATIPCGESTDLPASQHVWDMELQDAGGQVIPLYYGKVTVLREVTRA